jgi:hypothetical protein
MKPENAPFVLWLDSNQHQHCSTSLLDFGRQCGGGVRYCGPMPHTLTDDSAHGVGLRHSAVRFLFAKDYSNDVYGGRESNRMTMGDSQAPQSVTMDPNDTVLHASANCCNEHDDLKLLQNGSNINARNRRGRSRGRMAELHHNLATVVDTVTSTSWSKTMIATCRSSVSQLYQQEPVAVRRSPTVTPAARKLTFQNELEEARWWRTQPSSEVTRKGEAYGTRVRGAAARHDHRLRARCRYGQDPPALGVWHGQAAHPQRRCDHGLWPHQRIQLVLASISDSRHE